MSLCQINTSHVQVASAAVSMEPNEPCAGSLQSWRALGANALEFANLWTSMRERSRLFTCSGSGFAQQNATDWVRLSIAGPFARRTAREPSLSDCVYIIRFYSATLDAFCAKLLVKTLLKRNSVTRSRRAALSALYLLPRRPFATNGSHHSKQSHYLSSRLALILLSWLGECP